MTNTMPLGRGLSALIPSRKPAVAPAPMAVASALEDRQNRIWFIPATEIHPNPHQPRKDFSHGALEELIASIKEHGILQPLLVSERPDGAYELISGERRLRAATIAGLPTVPCIVKHVKDEEKLELALVENIQRKELNAIEEAFAYHRLHEEFGLTHEEVAQRVGKSRPYVSNMIRLLALPDEIKKALAEGLLPYSKARAILGLESAKDQRKFFKRIMRQDVGVSEVERTVRHASGGKSSRRDPMLDSYERELRDALQTKVRITGKGGKGTITIEYYSPEEAHRIVKVIASR